MMDWHSDADLDRLDAYLMALPEENDPMLLPEFDGFCAGLIVCPEMVPTSEWLPLVWGKGGLAEFDDMDQMQASLDLIMAHYNRVASMLMVPGEYYPVLDEDRRNGDILWEFWMLGFLAAMRLRPEAWSSIQDSGDQRAIKALLQTRELGQIAEDFAAGRKVKMTRLIRQAPELIPQMVDALNAFTKRRSPGLPPGFPSAANSPLAPAAGPKVGRNDPCPCGSGKKFKKCCGAGGAPVH